APTESRRVRLGRRRTRGWGGGPSFAGSPAWRSACQRSGSNSSIRRAGWVLIRSSTSRRYACGSIPRFLHVVHRLISTAAVSPPLSLPTKSQGSAKGDILRFLLLRLLGGTSQAGIRG